MNILEILTKRRIVGNKGEDAVCKYLRKQKYKIIARNYVDRGHEIDIIAENAEFICFVEVKTRTIGREDPREPRPASSVTPEKQRAIIAAARGFAASEKRDKQFRFDVAEVFITSNEVLDRINYLEGAFTLDTSKKHYYERKG